MDKIDELKNRVPEEYKDVVNEERIKRIKSGVENCFSFTTTVIIYLVVSLLISIIFPVLLYYKIREYGYPILFFIFEIPVVVGMVIIGVRNGIIKSIKGVKIILNELFLIIEEIGVKIKNGSKEEKIKISINYVIMPIVKIFTSSKTGGEIIYLLIKKISEKAGKKYIKGKTEEKKEINREIKVIKKIKDGTVAAVKIVDKILSGICFIILITGIIFCISGIIMLTILTVIYCLSNFG